MPGVGQRQAGGVGAEPLPGFHLALVGLLRNLRVVVDRPHRVDAEGRREGLVDHGLRRFRLGHRAPVRVEPLAKAGDQPYAGDPDLARHLWPLTR